MKNKTKINIPKKYQSKLQEVFKDSDGYWAYSDYGYYFELTETHVASEETQKEFLSVIRTLKKCNCEECSRGY